MKLTCSCGSSVSITPGKMSACPKCKTLYTLDAETPEPEPCPYVTTKFSVVWHGALWLALALVALAILAR